MQLNLPPAALKLICLFMLTVADTEQVKTSVTEELNRRNNELSNKNS